MKNNFMGFSNRKNSTLSWILFLMALICFGTIQPSDVFAQLADSTRQLVVEKIEIVGNSKTRPEVIYRYLTLRPGKVINPALVAADQRRLLRTNFFKEVDFYTRPGSSKGKLILVIEVRERRWPYFQFEGGHSDLSSWYFVPASLRFDNFFGRGYLMGLRWYLGDRISKLSLGFHSCSLFDNRIFLDVELFGGNLDFVHFINSDPGNVRLGFNRSNQQVAFGGLKLKTGANLGLFKYVNFGFRSENFDPDDFIKITENDSSTTILPAAIQGDILKTKISAFSIILNADKRDNPIYPMKGFWGALSLELAHDAFGSERNFPKITLDSRFYKKVLQRQVLAFHLKAGYTKSGAPFYERFYLGGANSVRGYPDRRLTPVGWGTKMILTNSEYRFPISTKNFPNHKVSGVIFFDAGGVWLPGEEPKFEDLFAAVGFGFRVRLPVLGITRFDFAFPLKKVDNSDFQFHISLGHTF
ncbi:MAG: outer membrane protein assembly factor [bacterium]